MRTLMNTKCYHWMIEYTHGLRMDRSLFNHKFGDLMDMQNGDMQNMRKTSMGMNYRVMRKINNCKSVVAKQNFVSTC